MSTIRELWVPLLAGLLVATVIGPGVVGAAEPRATVSKITIPAAAFIPTTDDWDYDNNGYALDVDSGYGTFTAPLVFPAERVKIHKITLYAYDNSTGQVCAALFRGAPANGNEVYQGDVCTSDSTDDPQVVTTKAISPRWVSTLVQGAFLWAYSDDPGLDFYGVTITYSY